LQSGTYRIIEPTFGAPSQSGTVTIDAATLQVTTQGGTGTLVPNGECRYTDSSSDVVVSPAGVVVARSMEGANFRVQYGFPEQTLAVSDLAGTWNMLGAHLVSGSSVSTALYGAVGGLITVSSAGEVSGEVCDDITSCSPITDSITVSSNPAGGFDVANATEGSTSHLFAYRAPSGDVSMVNVDDDGSVAFFTRQRTNAVSAAGTKSASWGIWMNTFFVSPVVTNESSFTTTANDAAAGTWTRVSDIDGHIETLFANNPRNGYTFRQQGTATATGGATVTVSEFTALPLAGTGVNVLWLPTIGTPSALGALFFAVAKP
jgi:hypothetical protein